MTAVSVSGEENTESDIHRIDIDDSDTLHRSEVELREGRDGKDVLPIVQGAIVD